MDLILPSARLINCHDTALGPNEAFLVRSYRILDLLSPCKGEFLF
jgi:hypothetical protein